MGTTALELIEECRPTFKRKITYNRAYRFLYALLSNRVVSLFDWKGLPFEQHELELRAQLGGQGYTGIVYSGKLKRWIVATGSGVGVTEYPDKWINYTWACPLDSGISKIDTAAVLVKNNSLLIPTRFLVEHYAHLMAHAVLSLQAILINSRATGYSTARDDQTIKSIKKFYEALEDGKTEVVRMEDSLNAIAGQKPIEFISDRLTGNAQSVLDYWQLIQNLYKDFLSMIGVSKSTDKRERLITSEVEQDLPLYRFNIEDMLDVRKQAAEILSRVLGTTITVDLAESVKRAQEGGSTDAAETTRNDEKRGDDSGDSSQSDDRSAQ